jgi:hypothetical protein
VWRPMCNTQQLGRGLRMMVGATRAAGRYLAADRTRTLQREAASKLLKHVSVVAGVEYGTPAMTLTRLSEAGLAAANRSRLVWFKSFCIQ